MTTPAPLPTAFGWMVLHSDWQIGLVWLIYARTLTDLKIHFFTIQTPLAMQATGQTAPFFQRIRYILGLAEPEKSARSPLVFFVLLAFGLAMVSMKMIPKTALPTAENLPEMVSGNSENSQIQPDFNQNALIPLKNDSLPPSRNRIKSATEPPEKTEATQPETGADELPPPERAGVAISVEKMNIFYVGVENPIRIAANEFAASEIEPRKIGSLVFKWRD